jgi:hypothetical protein
MSTRMFHLRLTGLGKRRGGHITFVSVPRVIKLIIYTEMSAYHTAALLAYRLLPAGVT